MNGGSGDGPGHTETGDLRRWTADIAHYRITGQTDKLMNFLAPDAGVYFNCSKQGLNPPGVWLNKDGFREHLRRTDIDYESLGGEVRDIIAEGNRSVILWRSGWRHRGTGRAATIDMLHFLCWRGDKIVELQEFVDYAVPGWDTRLVKSFDELIEPRPPGLDREELVRRLTQLALFPSYGPDVRLIRELCSPDVVCEFVGDRARIPYAGRHAGLHALVNIVRAIAVDFEQTHESVSDIVVDRGRIAGRRSVEWRHRGTGRRGVVRLADFVRFEDGLIVEIIEFRDSVTVLEMQD